MFKKKVIGIGTNSYSALLDAESKLPYPLRDSSKYLEIETLGPDTLGKDFKFTINYTLKSDSLDEPRRRPIDEVVEEALRDIPDPLTIEDVKKIIIGDVKKIIDTSVDEAVKRYFKGWMKET